MILEKSNGITASLPRSFFVGFRLQTSLSHNPSYLNMIDLTKTTSDIRMAWVGTAAQVKAVRKLYPNAKRLKAVRHSAKDSLRPLPSGY